MSESYFCTDCGGPIEPGKGFYDDSGSYHTDVAVCIAALKADRDRYRSVLVALRDAERACEEIREAYEPACRAHCLEALMARFGEAITAQRSALAAAIAAVEEAR